MSAPRDEQTGEPIRPTWAPKTLTKQEYDELAENAGIPGDPEVRRMCVIAKGPYKLEAERFREAFHTLMKKGVFPTPTRLNELLGRKDTSNIPGRLSKMRRKLLHEAGYRQQVIRYYDGGGPVLRKHWKWWDKETRCWRRNPRVQEATT